MARIMFPIDEDRLTASPSTNATLYANQAGTVLADVQTYPGGVAISGSVVTTDSSGNLPLFYGPASGVDELFIQVGSGAIRPIHAHRNERVDVLTDTVTAASATYLPQANAKIGFYQPSNWGAAYWKPKRNACPAGKARIAVIGDSIMRGFYSSALRSKGHIGLCATALQATYGDGGSGFHPMSSSTVFSSAYTGYSDIWTLSSGWSVFTGTGQFDGPGSVLMGSTASFGSPQTATYIGVRGDKVSIYYLGGSGAFSYTVDGGAAQNVSSSVFPGVLVASSSGWGAGSHTVVVTAATSTPSIYLYGASGENNTGLVVNNYASAGMQSSGISNVSATGTDGPHAQQAAALWQGGNLYPADLVIYGLGANDAHNGVAADTYLSNVAATLAGIRTGNAFVDAPGTQDILLVRYHIGKYDSATPLFPAYSARLRGLAESYGAAYLDLWAVGQNSYGYNAAASYWGNGTNSGATGTDAIHPGDAGHLVLKNILLPILTA